MDVWEKLEVIAHLGDHITYKEDIGICYDSDLAKVIEDAYMTLKNGVTVQEWISVKDRLPEEATHCLVAHKTGVVKTEFFHFAGDPKLPAFGYDWVFEDKYTHWMPLPDAPTTCHMTSKQPLPKGE